MHQSSKDFITLSFSKLTKNISQTTSVSLTDYIFLDCFCTACVWWYHPGFSGHTFQRWWGRGLKNTVVKYDLLVITGAKSLQLFSQGTFTRKLFLILLHCLYSTTFLLICIDLILILTTSFDFNSFLHFCHCVFFPPVLVMMNVLILY